MFIRGQTVVVVCVLIGGCQSSGTGAAGTADGGGPAGDSRSAAGFCDGYFSALTGYLARCLALSPAQANQFLDSPLFCQRFTSSVTAGRTRFDPSSASACVAALAAAPCDSAMPITPTFDACAGVITPLVPVGGMCKSFYILNLSPECTGDAFCAEGKDLSCSGTCTARLAVGQACNPDLFSFDSRCVHGARCDSATKRCVALPPAAAADQPCGGPDMGECQGGLYCAASGNAGVCRPRKSSGACSDNHECAPPALCVGDPTAKSCAVGKKAGEACHPGWRECGFGTCGADGKCTDTPAPLNAPCGRIGDETVSCAPGTYCQADLLSSGTCRASKKAGEPCTGVGLSECDGNNGHCDETTKLCVACDP